MNKWKLWTVPFIAFTLVISIVAITTLLYHEGERTHEKEKSAQLSYYLSKNMSREIEYRLQALKVVARQIHKVPGKAAFASFAQFLLSEYTGFFAINFIDSKGTIQQVYPEQQNKNALGHNLLDERPDLREYLLEAKSSGEARVTHRISTYQKIYAVVIYVPLYDDKNNFLGWLNGVLSVDNTFNSFMQSAILENVSARVRWHHPSDTNTLTYKWSNPAVYHSDEFKLMNQTVSIDVAFGSTPLERKRDQLYLATLGLRAFLVLTITLLIMNLTLSRINLADTNEKLSFNNRMLTSLSHDVAAPVTALYLAIQLAIENSEVKKATAEKFISLIKTIEDMLKSIRMLHGYGMGVQVIPIEDVPVLKALQSAVNIVELMAKDKNISFENSHAIGEETQVKANAHTLVNNVFINVLTNAIKFSPKNSVIRLESRQVDSQIQLIFTDQGKGISAENLERFKNTDKMTSQKDAQGNAGTGLGLLQISGFMRLYGGKVQIENQKSAAARTAVDAVNATATGTKVTLSFKKV